MILSITTWWEALSSAEQIYWGIAIVASAIFIIQTTLTLIGLDSDVDFDVDDLDTGFSVFSVRSVIAFFVFFGWGGVAALASGLRPPQALMIAFLIGFLAMVAIAYVFFKLLQLQESGTVDVKSAISREAEVYLTIPGHKEGIGKIHVDVEGKMMEFDAVTADSTILTGSIVRVKNVDRENVMLVEPI